MPKVLITRPNRTNKRLYTRDDAARIVCRVLGQGIGPSGAFKATAAAGPQWDRELADILARVEARCGRRSLPRTVLDAAAAAAAVQEAHELEIPVDVISTMGVAVEQLEESSNYFNVVLEILGAILTYLSIVATVAAFIPTPQTRLVAVGARAMVSRVQGFIGRTITRKAANDSAFIQVKRAYERLLKAA